MSEERRVACEKCFADRRLVEFVRSDGELGSCPWCGSKAVATMTLSALGSVFREAARMYEPVDGPGGDRIGYLLQQDWNVFSDLVEEDTNKRDKLAVAILEAGLHPKDDVDEPDYRGGFRNTPDSLVEDWYSRLEHLIAGRKPDLVELAELDGFPDRLVVAIEDMVVDLPKGSRFVRARLHAPRQRVEWFLATEMGPPPPEKTPSQRANREGEPACRRDRSE